MPPQKSPKTNSNSLGTPKPPLDSSFLSVFLWLLSPRWEMFKALWPRGERTSAGGHTRGPGQPWRWASWISSKKDLAVQSRGGIWAEGLQLRGQQELEPGPSPLGDPLANAWSQGLSRAWLLPPQTGLLLRMTFATGPLIRLTSTESRSRLPNGLGLTLCHLVSLPPRETPVLIIRVCFSEKPDWRRSEHTSSNQLSSTLPGIAESENNQSDSYGCQHVLLHVLHLCLNKCEGENNHAPSQSLQFAKCPKAEI